MYYLKCLGPPVLERDGTAVKFTRKKSLALLAYLAVTRRAESRDSLAALLWPDQPPAPSSGYLRTALYDINTVCADRLLEADRQTVRLANRISLDVDVWKFHDLVGGRDRERPPTDRTRLAEAVGLFRGAFMSGFNLRDAPPFEDWQRECAEELTRACEEALQDIIRACVGDGATEEALGYARRLVAMDELDEGYHRVLMSLEALAGKPVAVELAWQRCCRILKRELDAQPDEETRKLYDRLRSARGATPDERLVRDLLGGLLGRTGIRRPAWAPARAAGPAVLPEAPAVRLPEPAYPCGVTVDGLGRIYFTEVESSQVVRMDDMDGRNAVAFGSGGSGPGQFGMASAVCLDTKGRIYVADPRLDRIVRCDGMDGSGWVSFGTKGSRDGCFAAPAGVCVDQRGRIHVADCGNNRIVRFDDMDGSGWVTLGGPEPAEGPGRFAQPFGIFVDPSGWIYVSVHPATVVRMDDMDGSGWVTIRPANLGFHRVRYTRSLTVDPERNAVYLVVEGNVVASDIPNAVICIVGLTGLRWTSLVRRQGASRSHPDPRDGFMKALRVCVDDRHRLYITDPVAHRIVRVDDIYGNGWTEFPPRPTPGPHARAAP